VVVPVAHDIRTTILTDGQLGNNRGNKYSKKSVNFSPDSPNFWNFSIDEFALHDIPDSIAYILDATDQKSLSYIGFSQGTAQAFASLSVHPMLNNQVNVFIALAPAMSPAGLHNGIVDALMKASPQVLFLLFGRRSILSSATMWESILYPPIFTKTMDLALGFLFNWRTKNISTSQKLAAYPHLYSFTSTKSVVHWFQIIRNKSFQMYDDDVHPPISLSSSKKYTRVPKYPTRNIRTPIVLVYGGSDSLVDIKVMLRELPKQTVATEIRHYEHLDFLWARDVDSQVFPHVFDALESFTGAEHTKEEYDRYRTARHNTSLSVSQSFAVQRRDSKASDVAESDANNKSDMNNGTVGEEPDHPDHHRHAGKSLGFHRVPVSNIPIPKSPIAKNTPSSRHRQGAKNSSVGTDTGEETAEASHGSDKSSPVHPNTSEKMHGEEERPQTPSTPTTKKRRAKDRLSLDSANSMKDGRGITIGASKAVGGVTSVTTGRKDDKAAADK
jgi:lysosomal acid lipase/cholesteryl ester hydrolase